MKQLDRALFYEGKHYNLYKEFGAHIKRLGTQFSVYAPHAKSVKVVGDFNKWDGVKHQMRSDNGIWTLSIPRLKQGEIYKYEIETEDGKVILKSDPFGYYAEHRPNTASITYHLEGFKWTDSKWIEKRKKSNVYEMPLNIYEMHLGSWKREEELIEAELFSTYKEIGDKVIEYVLAHNYTHIELMPLYEHPFDGSWGYQATGYFAASSRYGEPKDLMKFINQCHAAGIGVIMDWVPGHFCRDAHGLYKFDGSSVYEYSYEDIAVSEWGTANFDLGRGEVQSFLISNALFWMEYFHIDGFRVDAVANMIYWDGNKSRGINENAIKFLKHLNEAISQTGANVLMIAEDSTNYPMVTAPTSMGGLGFTYKWNMGWMNDTLRYLELEYNERMYHHQLLSFVMVYNYNENFVLPFSHDEIVHGKKSLVDKAPGDYWQKMAQFRLLMSYQMTMPGKKLNFMTNEMAQFHEWKDKEEVDWHLLKYPAHDAANKYIRDLNKLYLNEKALWELDHSPQGFEWIDVNNNQQSIYSFIRKGKAEDDVLIIVLNFKPTVYHDYRVGVPLDGEYIEILNSDRDIYHGSNQIQCNTLISENEPIHGKLYSVKMTIPPYGASILKYKTTNSIKTEKETKLISTADKKKAQKIKKQQK